MSEHPNEQTTLLAKHKHPTNYTANADKDAAKTAAREDAADTDPLLNDDSQSVTSVDGAQGWLCELPLRLYLVEPMVLILVFAYSLSSTVFQNQIIYQTCTAIVQFNESDCKLLGTRNTSDHIKKIESLVQPYSATIFMTIAIVQSIVPALCGIFIGAWSDRFGRKPLLITSFTGYSLYYLIATLISYFSEELIISPWYYLLAVMPNSLLGDGVTYSVATFCYISDVSTTRELPYRMVLYEAVIYVGLMIGTFTSGYLYDATSAPIVFAVSTGSILFATFIIICFVPESLNLRVPQAVPENVERANGSTDNNNTLDANDNNNNIRNTFIKLFDVERLMELWRTCFKPREFNDRAIIWLTISVLLAATFVVDGSGNVFYLFVRKQFHWTVKEFTTYETINILIPILGNISGIWLLRKWLRMSVLHLAIMAFLSQTFSSFARGFAFDNWQLYFAIVLGALKSIGNPMCRTIITNIVPANELGKIFSFSSVLQTLIPLLAAPVYTLIYKITLESFPGFFNIISANIYLLAIALLLVILRKKSAFSTHYHTFLS